MVKLQNLVIQKIEKFTEENYSKFSKEALQANMLSYENVEKCVDKSFVSKKEGR